MLSATSPEEVQTLQEGFRHISPSCTLLYVTCRVIMEGSGKRRINI